LTFVESLSRVTAMAESTVLPTQHRSAKETPNHTSAAGGIDGCGIILDAGAAENGLLR